MRWLALFLMACGADPERGPGPHERAPEPTCEAGAPEDHAVVLRTLAFGRSDGDVSDGFDLDGTSEASCGIQDFTSPGGDAGIDNSFANLLPALELTEAAAVESLVQAAIDSGELMITLELEGLDDLANDDCVDIVLGRAAGTPMVGTDGRLLPGQTLDRGSEAPVRLEDVKVVDGVFEAPFAIVLPVTIFEIDLQFELTDGRIRGTIDPDGSVHGVFAGGVDIEYLLSIALEENVDSALHGILQSLLYTWADLGEGCDHVSITFEYTSSQVFFFDDAGSSPAGG